ncbi:MAG TPA: nitrilase-related carbon-nitrogen hydrolase [Bryobacteraceae bacterium]|nr:nitrilase-related carbon-nitrogen hydrolase [Bryobacteraceae bacterium]
MMTRKALSAVSLVACVSAITLHAAEPARPGSTVRLCTAQPPSRLIDYKRSPSEALAEVDRTLAELEKTVHRAGTAGCDAFALPEDTLGLVRWEAGNKKVLREVLPAAVARMLDRLGRAAAAHRMYLVCSSDTVEPDGKYRNMAFFLGRDAKEIGRYQKVHPAISETDHERGTSFPVFETPDLGGVGMLICYDMVMPESSRSLAMAGADVIFLVTLGGATTAGDPDSDDESLNRASFRTRAADNFVYIVVAKRGGGAMVISPQGKVLAQGKAPGDIVTADVNPFAGRRAGDAWNVQTDMRARLFRERTPAAYGILTDPAPPALKKVPETITPSEALRIAEGAMTVGSDRFSKAEALLRAGRTEEAIRAFEKLRADYPTTWIDRAAGAHLAKLKR